VPEGGGERLFVVLCASGFESVERMRSALMFSSLGASAGYRSVLYCVQNAVEVMVRGEAQRREKPVPGTPTLGGRLAEALEAGVEIQCCSQTLKNRGIEEKDLIEGAVVSGAMALVSLATRAEGTLSF
jgi:predicted peroxiredoxin